MEQNSKVELEAHGHRAIAASGKVTFHSNQQSESAHFVRTILGDGSNLPSLSQVLKECTVPQIRNHLTSEEGMCALGAIANKAGLTMSEFMQSPEKIVKKFNCSIPELNREVNCPHEGCHPHKTKSIFWMMPHLNDDHGDSFKQIGTWLEQYDL